MLAIELSWWFCGGCAEADDDEGREDRQASSSHHFVAHFALDPFIQFHSIYFRSFCDSIYAP